MQALGLIRKRAVVGAAAPPLAIVLLLPRLRSRTPPTSTAATSHSLNSGPPARSNETSRLPQRPSFCSSVAHHRHLTPNTTCTRHHHIPLRLPCDAPGVHGRRPLHLHLHLILLAFTSSSSPPLIHGLLWCAKRSISYLAAPLPLSLFGHSLLHCLLRCAQRCTSYLVAPLPLLPSTSVRPLRLHSSRTPLVVVSYSQHILCDFTVCARGHPSRWFRTPNTPFATSRSASSRLPGSPSFCNTVRLRGLRNSLRDAQRTLYPYHNFLSLCGFAACASRTLQCLLRSSLVHKYFY